MVVDQVWTEGIVVFVCHEDLECTHSVISSAFKCAHTQKKPQHTRQLCSV